MLPLEFAQLADHILPKRIARWAPEITAAAVAFHYDPLLIAAVMDRESNGGDYLTPKGPAGTGDKGHGRGLMQIDDRTHKSFVEATFNGEFLWKMPAFNILTGTCLLAHELKRFKGEVWPSVAAYNAGPGNVLAALKQLKGAAQQPELRIAAADSVTTGKDYASDVKRRWEGFNAAYAALQRKGRNA